MVIKAIIMIKSISTNLSGPKILRGNLSPDILTSMVKAKITNLDHQVMIRFKVWASWCLSQSRLDLW